MSFGSVVDTQSQMSSLRSRDKASKLSIDVLCPPKAPVSSNRTGRRLVEESRHCQFMPIYLLINNQRT
jgi:hypothetical protein